MSVMPQTSTIVGLKKLDDEAPLEAVKLPAVGRKTYTNWSALAESGLKPVYIRCNGYFPVHPYDNGCHTALSLSPEQMAKHTDGEHGGGFFLSFREGYQTDPIGASNIRTGRHWDGWAKFEELGLELRDLRCHHCNAEIKVNSRSILKHIKNHPGKGSKERLWGDFWMTLTRNPTPDDPDEDE